MEKMFMLRVLGVECWCVCVCAFVDVCAFVFFFLFASSFLVSVAEEVSMLLRAIIF